MIRLFRGDFTGLDEIGEDEDGLVTLSPAGWHDVLEILSGDSTKPFEEQLVLICTAQLILETILDEVTEKIIEVLKNQGGMLK